MPVYCSNHPPNNSCQTRSKQLDGQGVFSGASVARSVSVSRVEQPFVDGRHVKGMVNWRKTSDQRVVVGGNRHRRRGAQQVRTWRQPDCYPSSCTSLSLITRPIFRTASCHQSRVTSTLYDFSVLFYVL